MRAIVVMCRFEADEWWLCFSQVRKKVKKRKKKKEKKNTSIRIGYLSSLFLDIFKKE
jgi:hypothetical protein